MEMPHYLWGYEYCTLLGNALFIADPTYIRSTTKSIFLNKVPLISMSQISLLRYDDKAALLNSGKDEKQVENKLIV